jgi:diguanylate cyclase (GGDEF)-like protein
VRAVARVLEVTVWCLLVLCPATMVLITRTAPSLAQSWVSASMAAFFLVLLGRLACAAALAPARRRPLLLLLFGVLLFAAGSAVLNGSGQPDLTQFPAPGEWLFLGAYVAIAGYLVLDASKRVSTAGAAWLETAVICGGTACLAGSVLVTAAARQLAQDGLPLLLAVLYPLIDVILGLLVVAQVVLRARPGIRDGAPLLAGFALFAAADSSFLLHLSSGTYDFSNLTIVMWGIAFALVVGHACRTRRPESSTASTGGLTTLVVGAGMCAAAVLAIEPAGPVRDYLVPPALATLAAAGARLVLAVRAANKAAEAIRLSRSDDLTLLPNRRAVLARLDELLATDEPLGLMILDLDGFKDINDTLGHAAGDAVLREVATRMRLAIRPDVMIARLGGDEFAVIATSCDEIELHEIAQDVLGAVRTPLIVDGIALSTGASIGIATRLDSDRLSSELLRRADVAMYEAKERRSGVTVYDPHSDDFSRERLRLGDELRRAVDGGQLVLWYQPQLDASTRRVCGLEALVRWNHPQHGLMNPAQFLPAARRAGLMQALSEEVARLAVRDLVRWQAQGLSPRVALNCAPPELLSEIFVPRLSAMLAEAGIGPDRIVIEVTEDSFLAEPERARSVLLDVRARGFQVSVDDYGTGFSSLSYLRDLPIQELKMDRSFVSAVCADERSRMIVASTFQMAMALGLRTVAEGVEDAATTAALVAIGVDVLQGYHFSRPIPSEDVPAFVEDSYALALRPLRLADGSSGSGR